MIDNQDLEWDDFAARIFYCGEILILRRRKLRLTQQQLANRLGISHQQIQRWEAVNYERCQFINILRVVEALSE